MLVVAIGGAWVSGCQRRRFGRQLFTHPIASPAPYEKETPLADPLLLLADTALGTDVVFSQAKAASRALSIYFIDVEGGALTLLAMPAEFIAKAIMISVSKDAATRTPAEFLRTLGTVGTIERSKCADLVLLTANPLDDIANTEKRAGVMVRGRWLSNAECRKKTR